MLVKLYIDLLYRKSVKIVSKTKNLQATENWNKNTKNSLIIQFFLRKGS